MFISHSRFPYRFAHYKKLKWVMGLTALQVQLLPSRTPLNYTTPNALSFVELRPPHTQCQLHRGDELNDFTISFFESKTVLLPPQIVIRNFIRTVRKTKNYCLGIVYVKRSIFSSLMVNRDINRVKLICIHKHNVCHRGWNII